jgi:YidC/Oxa1 family membrane protein insertase
MDRNSTIGFVLIAALLVVYFTFFTPDSKKVAEEQAIEQAKTEAVKPREEAEPILDTSKMGSLASLVKGEAKEYVLENKDIKVFFSSRGGKVTRVLAKNYVTYTKQPVWLVDEQATQLALELPLANENVNLYSLSFDKVDQKIEGDTTQLVFTANVGANQFIQQSYSLGKEGFTLGYAIQAKGINELDKGKTAQFIWKQKLRNFEKDAEQNRVSSTINYFTATESFEKLSEASKEAITEKVEEPVKWVALKEKFFNTAIIAKGDFKNVELATSVDMSDTEFIKNLSAHLEFPVATLNQEGGTGFTYYFGPNQYQICKKVTDGFEENVYLGWPVLNNLNRFVTVPIFNLLERFMTNYGLIILFLVLIIKLALFPLSYRSYLSMAKIRVLKPEMDEIKARHGDDMQKSQAETMKLYQSVGVNPLSGCVPVLLTMPVLLAIFNFFPNSIELRQQAFLWADDLSTYDVISKLPFSVPYYGDHVSLFTILMTISTLVYTWYNNQVSANTMQGPMVAMSYIMPVIFMFVLNSLPAALSYYYFVSNVVTIGQQMLIKNFVDEGKIREQLDANKVKIATQPQKQNRFMKRLEDAMKAQEEIKKRK